MFEHGVENGEQLTHARGEGELRRFAGGAEPLVEGDEDRVMAYGHDGTHVEHGPDLRAPAPDRPAAAEGAAIAVEGGDAHERRDLLAGRRARRGARAPAGRGPGRGRPPGAAAG